MVVERNVIEQWLAMFGYDETIETFKNLVSKA